MHAALVAWSSPHVSGLARKPSTCEHHVWPIAQMPPGVCIPSLQWQLSFSRIGRPWRVDALSPACAVHAANGWFVSTGSTRSSTNTSNCYFALTARSLKFATGCNDSSLHVRMNVQLVACILLSLAMCLQHDTVQTPHSWLRESLGAFASLQLLPTSSLANVFTSFVLEVAAFIISTFLSCRNSCIISLCCSRVLRLRALLSPVVVWLPITMVCSHALMSVVLRSISLSEPPFSSRFHTRWAVNDNSKQLRNIGTSRAMFGSRFCVLALWLGLLSLGSLLQPAAGQCSAVTCGTGHTCVIMTTPNGVRCWGDNTNGQLGDGTTASSNAPSPYDIPGFTGVVTSISAGAQYTCALIGTASAWCWGDNTCVRAALLHAVSSTVSWPPDDIVLALHRLHVFGTKRQLLPFTLLYCLPYFTHCCLQIRPAR